MVSNSITRYDDNDRDGDGDDENWVVSKSTIRWDGDAHVVNGDVADEDGGDSDNDDKDFGGEQPLTKVCVGVGDVRIS